MRARLKVTLGALLLASPACGGGSQTEPRLTTPSQATEVQAEISEPDVSVTPSTTLPQQAQLESRETWPLVSEPLEPCDDGATCAEGFRVGDAEFYTSCGQIKADAVTSTRIADGLYPVNAIEDVEPTVMVAYQTRAQRCNEGPEEDRTAWHFAFASNGDLPDPAVLCAMTDFERPGQPVPSDC